MQSERRMVIIGKVSMEVGEMDSLAEKSYAHLALPQVSLGTRLVRRPIVMQYFRTYSWEDAMCRLLLHSLVAVMLLMSGITTAIAQTSGTPADHAEAARFAGTVSDESGTPIELAQLQLVLADGSRQNVQTDVSGRFLFAALIAGDARLEVRRLGYRPIVRTLVIPTTRALPATRIVLNAMPTALEGLAVHDTPAQWDGAATGFRERQLSNHFGHFLDRAALEKTHAQHPSDALRSVPGLVLIPSTRTGNLVRFRDCRPTVWIDGIRIGGAELDEVASMSDMAGVEVYRSLAGVPQQFIDRTNPCGAILVWTRDR
jgi:hypothetical protein